MQGVPEGVRKDLALQFGGGAKKLKSQKKPESRDLFEAIQDQEPGYYLLHPLEILAVWKGGMSFHGGFLGVLVAMALWAARREFYRQGALLDEAWSWPWLRNLPEVGRMVPAETEVVRNEGVSCVQLY